MSEKKSTIEVTEKQKDKIVDMFAAEKAKAETTILNLMFQHEINNIKYGPGDSKVPVELEGHLTSADNLALRFKLKENQSSNTMVEILGRGISRIVSRS